MARIFVTGSTDGLGRLAAEALLADGHDVVVHARSAARRGALADLEARGASAVVGDFSAYGDVVAVADGVNRIGRMDAVIHNAAVGSSGTALTAVNLIAPYALTALIDRPNRLVYLSSSMHRGGHADVAGISGTGRNLTYSDSKLLLTAFAFAVARRWPEVYSNAVNPGWVPTKMGGSGAPDDLRAGYRTQVWLATSDDPAARTSGGYWFHQRREDPHPATNDPAFQERLLAALADRTGLALP